MQKWAPSQFAVLYRKAVSLLLAFVLVIGIFPTAAFAADTTVLTITTSGVTGDSVTTLSRTIQAASSSPSIPSTTASTVYVATINSAEGTTLKNSTGVKLTASYNCYLTTTAKRLSLNNNGEKTINALNTSCPGFEVEESDLISAGFQSADLDSSASHYYYAHFDFSKKSGSVFGLLIQVVQTQTVDKALLKANLDAVPQTGYYTENDRFNGSDVSKTSFWAGMQAVVSAAQAVYDKADTIQSTVDAAAKTLDQDDPDSDLSKAIAKLIPTTQVNATELYERLSKLQKTDKGYNMVPSGENSYTNLEQANYPEADWTRMETALTHAQELLAALYNEDGTPTDRNWGPAHEGDKPEDAITNEDLADALTGIYNAYASMRTNSQLDTVQTARQLAAKVDQTFPAETQGNYTDTSWNAFTAAREEAHQLMAQYPDGDSIPGSSAAVAFTKAMRSYYAAAYGLTENGEITVHVTVTDNFGALYPKYALTDSATALFDGDVTLADGAHSFNDLNSDRFDWSAERSGNESIVPLLMVYVNGQLVADTENRVVYGTASLGSTVMQLRDDDEVTIVRCLAPEDSYYVWGTYATLDTFRDYVQLLRFTTDGAQLNAQEGKSFTVHVERALATFEDYSNTWSATKGKQIVAYGPQNEDGSYPAAPVLTGFYTDENGNADVTLYAAGKYVLTAVDTTAAVRGETFPNLPGGARMEVTVGTLSSDEMEQQRQSMLRTLDALLARCNKNAMDFQASYYDYDESGKWVKITINPWTVSQEAYATAKTAITEADTLQAMNDALLQAQKVIENAIQRADTANQSAVSQYRSKARVCPTLEEVQAGKVITGDLDNIQNLINAYYDLTAYQKENLLTANEQAQYNALVDVYGKYTAGELELEKRTTYSIKLEYVGLQPEDMENPVLLGNEQDGYGRWPIYFQNDTRTEEVAPGKYFNMLSLTKDGTSLNDQAYELYDIQIVGADGESGISNGYPTAWRKPDGSYVWFEKRIEINRMPHNDVTIKLFVRSKTADLEGVRSAAASDLAKAYQGYVKSQYSSTNWQELSSAYQTGVNAIQAAETSEAIQQAKETAIAAMAAVKTLKQDSSGSTTVGDYGTVHVIMENTTCPDQPFYGEAGILSTDVALNESDTMMTVILDALKKEGYDWTGTGGSKGNKNDLTITYLASISKDGETLGEFTGSAKSGWMGTLNDWFTNEGFQSFSVKAKNRNYRLADGDQIHIMYTDDLGADLGGTWGNSDTSLKSLTVSGGTLSPSFASGTLSYVLTPGSGSISMVPVAANKNYQMRIYLNEKSGENWYRQDETIPAKVGDTIYIGVGERSWPSMNNQGTEAIEYTGTWYTIKVTDSSSADSVIQMIKNIPTVTYSNYKDLADQVALARTAYNGLSADAKAKVTNSDKLTAAEAAVKKFQEIDKVKSMLAALPNSDKATDAQVRAAKNNIEATDKAYKALSDEQKGYITIGDYKNYNALVERLSKLTHTSAGTISKNPNEEAASEVISLISAIGTVTKDSGDQIKAARSAYDKLTDAQKKLVSNYNVLTEAEAAFAKLSTGLAFTDVKESDYFYDAVKWAVEKEITKGTTATTFSPNEGCTRSQMVTFLWRAAGSPEPTSTTNPFTDVKTDAYYYKALLWAIENGITKGTTDTTFSPEETCTRGQMATFLYRNAKSPAVTGSASFTDVAADAYYSDAVAWAFQQGITKGATDTTFEPDATCTRGQMVTFLYRYLAK